MNHPKVLLPLWLFVPMFPVLGAHGGDKRDFASGPSQRGPGGGVL